MVYFGHVKNDVEVEKWDNKVSLLCSVIKGTFALASDGEIGDMEDCYLYHNEETGDFVRSGKAVGAERSFMERYKEHKHHAVTQKGDDLDSLFYHSHPSRQAGCIDGRMARKCYFENLSLHCGLAFSRDHLHPAIYESSGGVDAPQLFKRDKYVLGRIENVTRGT
jgi:hypothetical protein